VAVGCIYGLTAWWSLPVGDSVNMGPGYFPIVLSMLLVLLGAAIAVRSVVGEYSVAFEGIPWRSIAMNTLAILCFASLIRPLGLFPTVMLTASLSCLGSANVSMTKAAIAGFSIAVLCTLIFSFIIGLPIAIVGPWLGGFI